MSVQPSTSAQQPPEYKEPELDLENIQGNIVAGFKKPYQTLLYVNITDAAAFKPALAELVPRVANANAQNVNDFNLERKRRDPGSIKATWVNIAFSFAAITELAEPHDTVYFADKAFKAGLAGAAKVKALDKSTWKALDGHGDNAAHVLIIVAADEDADAKREVGEIKKVINNHDGAAVVNRDDGRNPATMAGKEHFGYRDCVSQPGLRGRAKVEPKNLLTPRPFDPDQGKPGQELIWPGEFVFGYQGQMGSPDGRAPGGDSRYDGVGALQVPKKWGKDGSYLVFRRFNQHVHEFHHVLHEMAKTQGEDEDFHGARIFGRWRSGAPISRAPAADDEELGENDDANNYFAYVDVIAPTELIPLDGFPPSVADPGGEVCPLSAHIRRANPRDAVPPIDRGQRRLLRRGILFGPPSSSTPQEPVRDEDEDNRGLLFLAYMTSIDRQFDGLSSGWSDSGNVSVAGVDTDALLGDRHPPWISLSGGGNYFVPSISALAQLSKQA